VDRRFGLFAVLVALIFVVNQVIFSRFFPSDEKKPAVAKQTAKADPGKAAEPSAAVAKPADLGTDAAKTQAEAAAAGTPAATEQSAADATPATQPPAATESEDNTAPQRGTLGSMDRDSPFRMLVTWNNEGAAIEKVELNGFRALEHEKPWGYLGYLAPLNAPKRGGALVRVVGAGTPAATAGVQVNDVITAFGEAKIRTAEEYLTALKTTEPGQQIEISILRGEETKKFSVKLIRQPMDMIRPEFENKAVEIVEPGKHDPLSFLATIQQFDERTLSKDDKELGGVNLRTSAWEVIESTDKLVRFRKSVPILGLEITKTYRLELVPKDQQADATFPAYSLLLDISIANVSDKEHKVAYRLDGPTGLPTEGDWYASKVSHNWGSAGLRDVIVEFAGGGLEQVSPAQLAEEDFEKDWGANASLDFIAVDAQYFAAALVPLKKDPNEIVFQSISPRRVGAVPAETADYRLINVSFRVDSVEATLAPGGAPLEHHLQIFAGPKRPALLAQYGPDGALKDLVYYGWFGPIARILGEVLHFFYGLVRNYGVAIVMLTVLVRGCMFPLSRKQALGAQKMQELQPEMKKINEKYKSEPEKRTKATQELFRTHKYNPVGGCLLAFAQLPIFVGLYRSLMVDIELRQAPLISEAVRWASNLAAPDMFWRWDHLVPLFVSNGTGIFGLGPFLNILPLFTIALFIWQQKMFMPPAADEQAAMQQKMMQYMMIFMGVLFFKVASGLCVYFIASCLWGVCERKLLPKTQKKADGEMTPVVAASSNGNGSAGKKRQRGRK
jgi:YidC/Oxa1 family membrane protein insertase